MNYYNENDPRAAAWLRALINAWLIPPGYVDERSITDVRPDDLAGFTQCHFFAGIGGWPLALQFAGWPADRPVWTGSCPCQPYSAAGKQLGNADERNLWPAFFNLISQCRPNTVFGEQVASAIGHGWLDGISADLEAENYACGAVVLGAHSVGAPHIRQRLFWVADGGGERLEGLGWHGDHQYEPGRIDANAAGPVGESGGDCWLRYPAGVRCDERRGTEGASVQGAGAERGRQPPRSEPAWELARGTKRLGGEFWGDWVWLPCADGKARRIEPGLSPLAHGVPARVVRLRGYGNAIVPQVAAEFIGAYIDAV